VWQSSVGCDPWFKAQLTRAWLLAGSFSAIKTMTATNPQAAEVGLARRKNCYHESSMVSSREGLCAKICGAILDLMMTRMSNMKDRVFS
jgi:hypothetical protein